MAIFNSYVCLPEATLIVGFSWIFTQITDLELWWGNVCCGLSESVTGSSCLVFGCGTAPTWQFFKGLPALIADRYFSRGFTLQ